MGVADGRVLTQESPPSSHLSRLTLPHVRMTRLALRTIPKAVTVLYLPSSVPRQMVGTWDALEAVASGSMASLDSWGFDSSAGMYTMHRMRDSTLKHSMTLGLEP